ncbi:MAG: MarR family transcriptional regulator, partial [Bifidobacteriaceae bacterium]|nr:MarR family transcriptional regulator [Bifidobacteriaceae bacterium]
MPSTGGPAAPAAPARQPRLGGGRADQGPGARQESLRRHNLAVVYQLVAGAPQPLSRAEIAERAGVTRATATSLVDQLVASRLVEELDARLSGRAGRPARPVCPARGTVIGLGLEVNVDYLGVRAIDLAGDVVAERVVSGDLSGRAPAETLTRLATAAKTVRRAAVRRGARIAGAALAVPGPVDRPLGPLRLAPNLGWVDVDVAGMLGRLLGATPLVRVDNEACLAARAERHARVRREQVPGYSPASGPPAGGFIYVSGGIGIGAGIVE